MKIIRIENASLWDLHNSFKDLIMEQDLAVLVASAIGSASHRQMLGPQCMRKS